MLGVSVAANVDDAQGQTLTLAACHARIDSGYPLVRQEALVRRAAEEHRKSSLMAYVPQLSVGGKATYQSDVTRVELGLPKLFGWMARASRAAQGSVPAVCRRDASGVGWGWESGEIAHSAG